jgi:hypothetical protein
LHQPSPAPSTQIEPIQNPEYGLFFFERLFDFLLQLFQLYNHQLNFLKSRECVLFKYSFTIFIFLLIRPQIIDHRLADDDQSSVVDEIPKPMSTLDTIRPSKDIESKENGEKKKDKKAEKEYVLKHFMYSIIDLFILVLVVAAKKMVKKKNQVEKMVKRRRNNCQMNICFFFNK